MYFEYAIVILIALALFLVLRHYPETQIGDRTLAKKNVWQIIRDYSKKIQQKRLSQIEEAISKNKPDLIAPADIDEAKKSFQEENPELIEFLYKANKSLELNDLREAETLALEAIAKNKRSAQAYIIIGKIANARGEFDDAKEAFKTALKCNASIPEAYFGMGEIERRDENYSEAIENYLRAISLDKNHADWYAGLGKAYLEVRQYAKAAKSLRRAASLDIDNKEYRQLASDAEDKQRSHTYVSRMK